MLEEVVNKVGSLDQEKMRELLVNFQTDSIMGHHQVDPATGKQIGLKGLLVQIRNGKREIIMPEDLKTVEAIIPEPAWDKR